MTENIHAPLNDVEGPAASQPHVSETGERQARASLAEELMREMAAWSPRDRLGAFRKWHQGSLSLIHLNVLSVLEAEGPQPMHRIAELLDVSDASATGIVARMEQRGLVERRHATDDRRLVLVYPTPAAADVFREAQEQRFQRLHQMLRRLDEEELTGLLAGIRGLHRARAELGLSPRPTHPGSEADPNAPAPAVTDSDSRNDVK